MLSLVPRLWNFDAPLVGAHEFRQTQTAITVQTMLEAPGFDFPVLDYETPLFGPPWRVPFEFPTYQLTAATLGRLMPGLSVDMACRIAALGWFYLSAALLFGLVRRQVTLAFATVSLGLYLWSPFAIHWSRAAMIDYCTVALGLGYLALGLWALQRSNGASLAGAVSAGASIAGGAIAGASIAGAAIAGALTAATKATSWPGVAFVLGLAFLAEQRHSSTWRSWPGRARAAGRALVLFGVPLAAGVAWTAWADRTKGASEWTRWLTSSAIRTWNFGRWSDRFELDTWSTLSFVPALLVGMALAGPVLRRRQPAIWRVAWPAALAAASTASTTRASAVLPEPEVLRVQLRQHLAGFHRTAQIGRAAHDLAAHAEGQTRLGARTHLAGVFGRAAGRLRRDRHRSNGAHRIGCGLDFRTSRQECGAGHGDEQQVAHGNP